MIAQTTTPREDLATCRGCGRVLLGRNYCFGGAAFIPDANGRPGRQAPVNYYGGYVCSRDCDYRSALELEQSMPGHGFSQKHIDGPALQRVKANWDRESS